MICANYEVMNRYEIIIYWSDEDACFIAEVPELPGCMAHGNSRYDALKNADEAIQLWIETAREHGEPIINKQYSIQGLEPKMSFIHRRQTYPKKV